MKPYQDVTSPLILAHRGGAGEAPENSLQAFQSAVAAGITHLETDVRASADGTLYLQHGASSIIPNRPYKPNGTPKLLTLPELFDAFPGCRFAIDPKHDRAVEPLAKLIAERELADRVCIGSSFDTRTERTAALIERLSSKRPCTALVSAWALVKLVSRSRKINNIQAAYIHAPIGLINKATVETAHTNGLKIVAWVVNQETTARRMLELGVDGFMTDYPKRVTQMLLLGDGTEPPERR